MNNSIAKKEQTALQMSEELDKLGGGETRIGNFEVIARIRPPHRTRASDYNFAAADGTEELDEASQSIYAIDDLVVVRDPRY